MILGTHKKANWRSRTAAAIMIIGAACVSAPLIQADAHPETETSEEELAGKYQSHSNESVIKRKYTKDGETVSEHYEINVDGDDVKAYKIGPLGKKTRIDVEDIEGVDVADLKAGHKGFSISDNDGVKFMSRKEFKKWAEKEYPEWKENDFANWVEGDLKAWTSKQGKGKLVLRDEDGETRFEFRSSPNFPKPPHPPGFTQHSENVLVFDMDDIEGLEGLEALKALKGLEGLEKLEALQSLKGLEGLNGLEGLQGLEGLAALKNLESLEGAKTFRFFSDEGDGTRLKLRITESRLAAARAMLEQTDIDIEDDSREMAKAKRELEKARKALKAAERALKDAK